MNALMEFPVFCKAKISISFEPNTEIYFVTQTEAGGEATQYLCTTNSEGKCDATIEGSFAPGTYLMTSATQNGRIYYGACYIVRESGSSCSIDYLGLPEDGTCSQ